jgi:hypothetical protein
VPVSDRIGAGNRDAAPGRPTVSLEIRWLIREMSIADGGKLHQSFSYPLNTVF